MRLETKTIMSPIRFNHKKMIIFCTFLVFVYIFLTSGYNDYQIDTLIPESDPETVWQYVADFRMMRSLNPTIIEFKVTADSGNHNHWKYSVEYLENLAHWPFWESKGHGDYNVIKPLPGQKEVYKIQSTHKTCFWGGFYCLQSESDVRFSSIGDDTYVFEKVRYQCAPLFSIACRRELAYQRQAVLDNLTKLFTKTSR